MGSCLVSTCNDGVVEEDLSENCKELIKKYVEKILDEKLDKEGEV